MLSRVIKGPIATAAPPMFFAPVRGGPQSIATSAVPDDRALLLEKIRVLESAAESAKREAFEAGHRKGEEEARAATAPVIDRLNASIAEIVGMRPELRRLAEKDTVDLALKIAKRILHRELSVDNNALKALARVVFDRLARSETWQLTVNPQFADSIRGAIPSGTLDRICIEADPTCAPGTLIARCADSRIDASVETQLDEINNGLMDHLS